VTVRVRGKIGEIGHHIDLLRVDPRCHASLVGSSPSLCTLTCLDADAKQVDQSGLRSTVRRESDFNLIELPRFANVSDG